MKNDVQKELEERVDLKKYKVRKGTEDLYLIERRKVESLMVRMLHIAMISLIIFLAVGCGSGSQPAPVMGEQGLPGEQGPPGDSCTVSRLENGALITCGETGVIVYDGQDGADGDDGLNGSDGEDGIDAVTEIIDPCGDDPGKFDEILLRLSTGDLLAYFEDGGKRFLTLLSPGNYRTTDKQKCNFSIDNDYNVSWE